MAGSIYASGIYVSKDKGENWEVAKIFNGEYEVGGVESFVHASVNGKEVIYAISAYAFYKREDGGENWKALKLNYSGIGSLFAVSEDGDLFCGSGGSGVSMFKASLENDTIWTFFQAVFESGSYSQLLTLVPDTVFTVFKGYDDSYVLLRSQSDGAQGTWESIKQRWDEKGYTLLVAV